MKLYNLKTGLKKARKHFGYTQKSLSEALKSEYIVGDIQTIRNWEQGRSIPSWDTLLKLAEFYGCEIDFLFDEIETETHDLEFICKETGLSADAVKILQKLQQQNDRLRKAFSDISLSCLNDLILSVNTQVPEQSILYDIHNFIHADQLVLTNDDPELFRDHPEDFEKIENRKIKHLFINNIQTKTAYSPGADQRKNLVREFFQRNIFDKLCQIGDQQMSEGSAPLIVNNRNKRGNRKENKT